MFLASLRAIRRGHQRFLNPILAAIGAVCALVLAAGPLVPVGSATWQDNLQSPTADIDLPTIFFVGRLVQVGLIAVCGVIGFLIVRSYGLGLVAGGVSVAAWLWVTSLLETGSRPVGIAGRNPGASSTVPHAVTTVGVITTVVVLLITAIVAIVSAATAYDDRRRRSRTSVGNQPGIASDLSVRPDRHGGRRESTEVEMSGVRMFSKRFIKRGAILSAAAAVGVFAAAGVASAHVSIEQSEVQAGAYELVTLGVPHGCDGSPTTEVRIQMPESIVAVTPTINPGWDVEKVMLDPRRADHRQPRRRDHRTRERSGLHRQDAAAGRLRDAFTLSLRIPDDGQGRCTSRPSRSARTASPGGSRSRRRPGPEELELPSPSVAVVAASGEAGGHGGSDAATTGATETTEVAATDGGDDDASTDDRRRSSNGLAIAALVVGVLGLGTGAVAIARTRKS